MEERTFGTIITTDEHGNVHKFRLTETTCIVEHVMLHKGGVQIALGGPPALYDTYECEGDQSWGMRQFTCVCNLPSQFPATHPVETQTRK
jgi:hypothetical protein